MNDEQLGLLIESWLEGSDRPPSDVGRSTAEIDSRLPLSPQRGRWWPLPALTRLSAPVPGRTPAGGSSMLSAIKFLVAAAVVALFGGFLLNGALSTPQDDGVPPAAVTDAPTPLTTGESAFPTGTFVADEDGLSLEFRPDGTCQRAGLPCTFGVRGSFMSEMTFEDPSGIQVPATYGWEFDGERLTFEPWGVDRRPGRKDIYTGHTYRPVGETRAMPAAEPSFPSGRFVPVGGSDNPALRFRENGAYTTSSGGGGKFVTRGNLWTEMTFNPGSSGVELVPATYYWQWDGERLMFRLWGEDRNRWRTADLLGHVFVRDDEAPLPGDERILLLSHPQLDIWITVEIVRGDDGRFAANATKDDEPLGEGVGTTVQEAVEAALEALGEPYASEIAESVKS